MRKTLLYMLAVLAFLSGCRDFIEPSIENRKVILLAPGNNTADSLYNQNFWWEPVNDALGYRLQVVTPSFDSINRMIIDTLVQDNKFMLTLEPGRFSWRVRAENGSSNSFYSTFCFTIYPSSITAQQVQLKSPADGLLTNQQEQLFSWQSLYGAAEYRVQIDTNNFTDENTLVYNNTTSAATLTFSMLKEKAYQWRVRAENDDEQQSKWSVIRKITFDNTGPAKVLLNAPVSGSVVRKPVNLSWTAISDAAQYELWLLKSDSTSVYNNTFPLLLNPNSYSFNLGELNEKIYWKVRAIDKAGNKGEFSGLRNFTIQ